MGTFPGRWKEKAQTIKEGEGLKGNGQEEAVK